MQAVHEGKLAEDLKRAVFLYTHEDIAVHVSCLRVVTARHTWLLCLGRAAVRTKAAEPCLLYGRYSMRDGLAWTGELDSFLNRATCARVARW